MIKKKVIIYILKLFLLQNLKTQKYQETLVGIWRKKISKLIKTHKIIVKTKNKIKLHKNK